MAFDAETYAKECTRIDDFDLNAEYVRLPADLAFWNAQYAAAYKEWVDAKLEAERDIASLAMTCRTLLEVEKKEKRVTVAEVEQHMLSTNDYHQIKRREAEAEYRKIKLAGICEAIRAKKDMLVSLGAHIRAEMGGDPAIRKQAYIDGETRR